MCMHVPLPHSLLVGALTRGSNRSRFTSITAVHAIRNGGDRKYASGEGGDDAILHARTHAQRVFSMAHRGWPLKSATNQITVLATAKHSRQRKVSFLGSRNTSHAIIWNSGSTAWCRSRSGLHRSRLQSGGGGSRLGGVWSCGVHEHSRQVLGVIEAVTDVEVESRQALHNLEEVAPWIIVQVRESIMSVWRIARRGMRGAFRAGHAAAPDITFSDLDHGCQLLDVLVKMTGCIALRTLGT